MIGEIFYWVVNMSIVATVTGVIVWLIGKIPRLPSWVGYGLWIVPFVRFILPIGVNSRFSLMSLISRLAERTVVRSVAVPHDGVNVSITNCIQLAEGYFPVTFRVNVLEHVFFIGGIVWLCVTLLLLTTAAVGYCRAIKDIKDATHLRDNIYISDRVSSPAVYGIFRAKIVLPSTYNEEDLELILRHERVHIRRKDNLWRVLSVIVACVHWFNPASWLFLKAFLARMELSCDEAVLKGCDEKDKMRYAKALLHAAENRQAAASPFGGASLKTRIRSVMSYKKLSALAIVASVLLVAATSVMLLTNAMS